MEEDRGGRGAAAGLVTDEIGARSLGERQPDQAARPRVVAVERDVRVVADRVRSQHAGGGEGHFAPLLCFCCRASPGHTSSQDV